MKIKLIESAFYPNDNIKINPKATEDDVRRVWRKLNIKKVKVTNEGHIVYDGSINIVGNSLTIFPFYFDEIMYDFNCSNNNIVSLVDSPSIIGGFFDCSENILTNLDGCPETIGGRFDFRWNNLTSLEGCPKEFGGGVNCGWNMITTLEGIPETIKGDFGCRGNKLTSLQHCPINIKGHFDCSRNKLITLKNCPKEVGGEFRCGNNYINFTEQYVRKYCDVTGEINNED